MASLLKLDAYDLIICGGGTAGLVLANRLTETPSLTILVLEAGENANDDFRISTPGLWPSTMGDPERDWGFVAEPSPSLNNRKIGYPRGKCLGGSSALNYMALIYPSRACLDVWSEIGNPGWGWDVMQKYFRKFQRHHFPPEEASHALGMEVLNEDTTAMNGPISSSYPNEPDVIQKAWIDMWKGMGKHLNGDPLSGDSVGGYIAATSVDPVKAQRSHAGVEYYAPIAKRENLHVVTGAMIDKVEFDVANRDSAVATGVVFVQGGNTYTARAKKEVILSTGTMGSSAILERSGIGSRDLCEKLGIQNVVENNAVGENFVDHLTACIAYEVKDGVPTADSMRDPTVINKVMEQYQTSQSGPLANGAGYTFAYTPLTDFVDPAFSQKEIEDLLDKHIPTSSSDSKSFQAMNEAFVRRILTSPNEASSSLCLISVQFDGSLAENPKTMISLQEPGNYITLLPQLAHPLSRGCIHISSTDPNTHPTIQPNLCGHPLDAEIMGRHLQQVETLAKTAPFSDLLKPGGRRLPKGHDALTLENAIELVRAAGTCNYHPSGTCAMKPREEGGVVDSRLKVYGTKNLRVCDASIFPIMVRGNIQSTVYAVAEKGADILKEDLSVLQ